MRHFIWEVFYLRCWKCRLHLGFNHATPKYFCPLSSIL